MGINKHVIVTGAGFSVPWGGPTAKLLSLQLFNDKTATNKTILRALVKADDYEGALDELRDNEGDRALFLAALERRFVALDKHMKRRFDQKPQGDRHLAMFLCSWSELVESSEDASVALTLNQDLGFERFWWERASSGVRAKRVSTANDLHVWGAGAWPASLTQPPRELGWVQQDIPTLEVGDMSPDSCRLLPGVNYLKLHGSANWLDDRGRPLLITGQDKLSQLKGSALHGMFDQYTDLMQIPELSVLAMGYSFRDQHVNRHLRDAVCLRGTSLVIVAPNAMEIGRTLSVNNWDLERVQLVEATIEETFSGLYGSGVYERTQTSQAGAQVDAWLSA